MKNLKHIEISPQVFVFVLLALETGLLPFFFGGASIAGRLIATLIVTLTAVLWFFSSPRLLHASWWKNPDALWIPVLCIALFSFAFTPSLWNTANEFWYLLSGALFFVAIRQLTGEYALRNVAWVLVLAAIPVVVWTLWTFWTSTTHELRAFGPLRNADGLGAYLVLPIFAAFGLLREHIERRRKILLSACLILVTGTLLLTSSVPAIASAIVACIVGVMVYRPRLHKRSVLIGAGTVVAIIVLSVMVRLAATRQTTNYFALPFEGMRVSLEQRVGFMQSSFHMAADRPWTGVGLGNWSDSFPRYAVSLLERTMLAHGVVFQYLAEGGWIFLLAFLWLLAATLANILAYGKRFSPLHRIVGLGVLAMAINGLGDISWFYPGIVLLFWGMAGLLLTPITAPVENKTQRQWLQFVIACLVLGTLAWGVLRFVSSYLTYEAERAAQRHDFTDALGTADLAMRFFPSPAENTALTTLQYLASTKQNRSVVQAWADRTLTSDRIMAIAYVIPARLARERGDTKKAESLYREGLLLDPHWTPDLSVELARLLMEQRKYEEAEKVVLTAAEQFGKDVPRGETSLSRLWELAGVAALNQGKRAVALERLEKAAAVDPNNSAASGLLRDAFGK